MASLPPPSGYGIWAIRIACAGSPHVSEVTCGFKINSIDSAAQMNLRLRTAMISAGSPFTPVNMATGFSILSTYVLENLGGLLFSDTDITPISGSTTLAVPSLNTALVIKKNTVMAGRQFRGRFMVPPMRLAETDISPAGIISGASLANATSQWAGFYGFLITQSIIPYLLHNPSILGVTPPPTPITSFTPTPLIGTIKRRIRP